MNRPSLVPIIILASSIAAVAAPVGGDTSSKQLQVYPKNLARQHMGANLFIYDQATSAFKPTEAAAAWLDDDITTGWSPLAGKQDYLLALPEAEVVSNFSLSGKASQGTVTIYGSDEPAAPGAKSWVPLVRDVSFDSVNEKKLAKPFTRLSKYLLIETNIAEPSPIYSVNLFGERPATAYQLVKRDQPIDVKAIFGPFVNEQTALNFAGLDAGARVAFSTSSTTYTGWQKAIDSNPESSVSVAATKDDAGLVVKFAQRRAIKRVAALADTSAKGKLEVFISDLPDQSATASTTKPTEGVQPVAMTTNAPITQPVSLTGLTPAATLVFDGSAARANQDLTGIEGGALLLRWTPDNGTDALALREINAFGDFSLSDTGIQLTPEAIAELARDARDGKALADGKDGKGLAPVKELLPVGEGFNRKPPYLPPSLGFPPPVPPLLPPELSQ